MKASKTFQFLFYLTAPFVLVLVAAAAWLAVSASLENNRVARVSELLIVAVAQAREMRFASTADAARAQESLMERFSSLSGLPVVTSPSGTGERGLVSPWGEWVRVFVYPAARAVRFEVPLSSVACRKILSFYGKDSASLGLQRVDVRERLPSALWRLVYEQTPTGRGAIDSPAIQAGCGQGGEEIVSLTFSL